MAQTSGTHLFVEKALSQESPEGDFSTDILRVVLSAVENEPPIYRVEMTIPVIIAVRDDLAIALVSSGMTGLICKKPDDWTNPMFPP